MLMLELVIFDNHQVYISNIYVTGDLVFLVDLLGKVFLHLNGVLNSSYI